MLERAEVIYPGHPLTIATFIVKEYYNWHRAISRNQTSKCRSALANGKIPGAGGCVHSALDMLSYIRQGLFSYEEAVEWANEIWRTETDNVYQDKWRTGQQQANSLIVPWKIHILEWIKGFCCETMRRQLLHNCMEHGMEDCPDVVVRPRQSSGYLLIGRNAEYTCNNCPWCGSVMNRSFWKSNQGEIWVDYRSWRSSSDTNIKLVCDKESQIIPNQQFLEEQFTEVKYVTV